MSIEQRRDSMMSQPVSDPSHDSQATSLRRRLAWRRTVLEVLGVGLVAAGLVVNWPPSDDPSLPATRPFLVLVGLLIFAAGLALRRQHADRENQQSEK